MKKDEMIKAYRANWAKMKEFEKKLDEAIENDDKFKIDYYVKKIEPYIQLNEAIEKALYSIYNLHAASFL